ncbi:Zn(II)2Cys6 transcription factor domain-containing protein [Aspergillus novofumigatus IBT 16806]|uniref:C6 zinc finger domain protein n=1 Tax=Aspergillus novofumigatus (strain IBT 16806) TaxID=1392255 RepID=A0A2I1BYY3_ASPN1|nr:C6 zinc finger domain protein [Aspergillus novofumigatus IBT 16806]PKX90561.1 C6 zinc finger domain protein [Aspergillus novofumigatus IBT 16806]
MPLKLKESQPVMRKKSGPRLAHRKSRNGCQRCRARRVKCDEARPVCRDCHRHGVACLYDRSEGQPPTAQTEQQRRSTPHAPSPPSQIALAGSHEAATAAATTALCSRPRWEGEYHAYTELRLLHHFTIGTSLTLPGAHLQSIKDCWSIEVPRLAFVYKPLLYAIFAISALHLYKSKSHETDLVGVRAVYLERALRDHRVCVGSIDTRIADAACFTCILLLIDAFTSLQDRPLDPYRPPMEWMQLVRGSVSVFDAALSAIQESKSARIFSIIHSSPSFTEPNFTAGSCDCGHFSYLLPSEDYGEEDGEQLRLPTLEIYRSTVAYINSVWLAIEAQEHPAMICRRLMVFPLIVSQEFLKLLKEMEDRALVILAHYFALSATLTDIWWVGHTPHREVLAIGKMVNGQWVTSMSWALTTVASHCRICTQS